MSATTKNDAPSGTDGQIDAVTLRSRLDAGAVRVLDVRTTSEFETAHIPGSYHVPLDTLGEHCPDLCDADGTVVVVCQSGARATQAAEQLAKNGMTGLQVLRGGMQAWTATGAPVAQGQERWSLERQVRLVAGSIVLTGVLASTKVPAAKWAAGFVGGGLTFAALSNTCMMGNLLARLPYNRGSSDDVAAAVEALVRNRPAPSAAA